MAMPSIQNRGVRRYENSWASISLMLLISGSVLVGLYGCGVAEGPAYLRFEGNVVDKEGHPAGGQEVQIQVEPNDLNSPDRSIGDELILTNADGKFTAQRGHWTGGLLIIPMALIVAPISSRLEGQAFISEQSSQPGPPISATTGPVGGGPGAARVTRSP